MNTQYTMKTLSQTDIILARRPKCFFFLQFFFVIGMPRQRKRTSEKGKNFERMGEAANEVLENDRPIRQVAKEPGPCHVSLYRYCKKIKNHKEGGGSPPRTGYNPHTRGFTGEMEVKIVEYLLKAADLYFGLTPKEVRRFAYKCA